MTDVLRAAVSREHGLGQATLEYVVAHWTDPASQLPRPVLLRLLRVAGRLRVSPAVPVGSEAVGEYAQRIAVASAARPALGAQPTYSSELRNWVVSTGLRGWDEE